MSQYGPFLHFTSYQVGLVGDEGGGARPPAVSPGRFNTSFT